MNEFELIRSIVPDLHTTESTIVGAGDDCAVVDIGLADRHLLLKTDAIVEGIHFTSDAKPELVGRKALCRCLSDIAAMGGTPDSALITLALPDEHDPTFIKRIYAGINEAAKQFDVAIVGGETTTNPDRMLLSIALTGHAAKTACLRRTGSAAGDAIFVTGELGGSLSGRHLEFEPRLAHGRFLAAQPGVHAMIDLSDGLAGDVLHLLEPEGLGAVFRKDSLPIARAAKERNRSGASSKAPMVAAFTDGEDYELLFTVASASAVNVLDAWKEAFPETPLTCIGRVTAEPGLRLQLDKPDQIVSLKLDAYEHFSKPARNGETR